MTLKAVIVGTSFGGRVHLPALRAAGFEVVGLVGNNPDRTAARAGEFGVAHHGTSITEVVEATDADVVTVSTPPAAHHRSVMEALAGLAPLDAATKARTSLEETFEAAGL